MSSVLAGRSSKAVEREARDWIDRGAVVLDTETTGLGSHDVLIDIAVIDVSGRVLFESLVVPPIDVVVSEGAKRVHGISDARLAVDGKYFDALYENLRDVLAGRPIVAFNADFDRRMWRQTCNAWSVQDGSIGHGSWHCAMLLAQRAMSTRKWPRLDEAAARYGVVAIGSHRAKVDAETCRGVLLKIAGVI